MRRFTNSFSGYIYTISLMVFFSGTTLAQLSQELTSSEPLTITSETLTVENKKNIARFDDKVVIKKGDLLITGDHVEITLNGYEPGTLPQASMDSQAVSKIRAWGNVILKHAGLHAQAREAIYNQENETVTLFGEPILFEEGYQVTGTKMIFYLKEDRSIIEESKVLIQSQEPVTSSSP